MNFSQSMKMAFKSIMGNKMRSFLTMLGIIIGVCAVIILVSIIQGATRDMTDRMESMGTNRITVFYTGMNTTKKLQPKDVDEMVKSMSNIVKGFAPNVSGSATVKYGNVNKTVNIIGTNEIFFSVSNLGESSGRLLTEQDVSERRNYAVIGTYNASSLFEGVNPLGQNIKINGEIFTVIGVLEEKAEGREGSDDDRIIVPYTSAAAKIKVFGGGDVRQYIIESVSTDVLNEADAKITAYLTRLLRSEDAFRIMKLQDMLDTMNEMLGTMTMVMGGIAGISLLVGGIGIMNIMLVSVTERTREIGIRKAIGAKRGSILTQFLIEAIVVSCMGGIIGIIIGSFGSVGIGNLMSLNATPGMGIIMLAFGFSACVGILFGVYPASKASKLSPIEALRFD